MKERNIIKFGIIILIAVILVQSLTLYIVYDKFDQNSLKIENVEKTIESEISSNKIEVQGQVDEITKVISSLDTKFNDLTSTVTSVSSAQAKLTRDVSNIRSSTSADFSGVIEIVVKGVVSIKTNVGQGSGFFITNDGYLVTNAHVLEGARIANAVTYAGESYRLDLIGYDLKKDIAVLKANGNFDSLVFGNSNDVSIGEKVIAIGNPLGLSFSVSEGIISAKDRVGDNGLPYYLIERFMGTYDTYGGKFTGPCHRTNEYKEWKDIRDALLSKTDEVILTKGLEAKLEE